MPVSPSPNPFYPSLSHFYREMKKILLPDLKFEKTKLKSKIPVIISHENGRDFFVYFYYLFF